MWNWLLRLITILTLRAPACSRLIKCHHTGTATAYTGERYIEQSRVGDDSCGPAAVTLGGKLQW